MKTYAEIKRQHQGEMENFPMFFAFSEAQFHEGKEKLGVTDNADLSKIPGGGFIRKTDGDALRAIFTQQEEEMGAAMKDREFLIGAIAYELSNHEFGYTYDPEPALNALGISLDTDTHRECFQAATTRVMMNSE